MMRGKRMGARMLWRALRGVGWRTRPGARMFHWPRPGVVAPDATRASERGSAEARRGAVPEKAGARGQALRDAFQLKRGFGSR